MDCLECAVMVGGGIVLITILICQIGRWKRRRAARTAMLATKPEVEAMQ
jgi:hypothetical protein